MTDRDRFEKFFEEMGVGFNGNDDVNVIDHDTAYLAGGRFMLQISGAHFHFDDRGNFLCTSDAEETAFEYSKFIPVKCRQVRRKAAESEVTG